MDLLAREYARYTRLEFFQGTRQEGPPPIERLSSLSTEDLVDCFAERLREPGSDRAPVSARGERTEDLLISEYRRLENDEDRARFRAAVNCLIYEWADPSARERSSEETTYLSRLIRLCDVYQVREANPWLMALAYDGNARTKKWKTPYDIDIHCQILRTLQFNQLDPGEAVNAAMAPFWLMHLDDPRYTAVSFRGLYIAAPDEAPVHFPHLVRLSLKNRDLMDLVPVLWLFLERCGVDRLLQAARQMAEEPAASRALVADALDKITGIPDGARLQAAAMLREYPAGEQAPFEGGVQFLQTRGIHGSGRALIPPAFIGSQMVRSPWLLNLYLAARSYTQFSASRSTQLFGLLPLTSEPANEQ